MFSAKQQKTPVSRTISAPVRKSRRQFDHNDRFSTGNRDVIQRVSISLVFHENPGDIASDSYDGFHFALFTNQADEKMNLHVRRGHVIVLFYMIQAHDNRNGEDFVIINHQGSRRFMASDCMKKCIAVINNDDLTYMGRLENRGYLTMKAIFDPGDPNRYDHSEAETGAEVEEASFWFGSDGRGWRAHMWRGLFAKNDFGPTGMGVRTMFNKGRAGVVFTDYRYYDIPEKRAYRYGLYLFAFNGGRLTNAEYGVVDGYARWNYSQGVQRVPFTPAKADDVDMHGAQDRSMFRK